MTKTIRLQFNQDSTMINMRENHLLHLVFDASQVWRFFMDSFLLQGPPGTKGEKGERVSSLSSYYHFTSVTNVLSADLHIEIYVKLKDTLTADIHQSINICFINMQ